MPAAGDRVRAGGVEPRGCRAQRGHGPADPARLGASLQPRPGRRAWSISRRLAGNVAEPRAAARARARLESGPALARGRDGTPRLPIPARFGSSAISASATRTRMATGPGAGFSRIWAGPQHSRSDPEVQAECKKTCRPDHCCRRRTSLREGARSLVHRCYEGGLPGGNWLGVQPLAQYPAKPIQPASSYGP